MQTDSKFTQQELPACKPILTPKWVSLTVQLTPLGLRLYIVPQKWTSFCLLLVFLTGYYSICHCGHNFCPNWSCVPKSFTRSMSSILYACSMMSSAYLFIFFFFAAGCRDH
jgi:hypothetical protein